MPDMGSKQRRMTANILVKAILDWGGKGKDVAEYLGVSPTTISHWRGQDKKTDRKTAVPSDDHLIKLLGILKYQVDQNTNFLMHMMDIGLLDRKTSILVSRAIGPKLKSTAEYFSKIQDESQIESELDQLGSIFDPGNPASVLSLMESEPTWGESLLADPEDKRTNGPVDFQIFKAKMLVDPALKKMVEAEAEAFPEFFNAKHRKPKKKGRKK